MNANLAVRRAGRPEEIAKGILSLASNKSEWITRAVIDLNGWIFMWGDFKSEGLIVGCCEMRTISFISAFDDLMGSACGGDPKNIE